MMALMNYFLFRLLPAAVIAFGILLSGCGEESETYPAAGIPQAAVRFVHAAPAAATAIQPAIDDAFVAPLQNFGTAQEEYTTVVAGNHTINLFTENGSTPIAGNSFMFRQGEHYTLFAVSDMLGAVTLLLYRDNLAPPPAGKSNIRIANLIPDAPPVRLAFSGSGLGPIFNDIHFAENAETFKPVDAGEVTLRVVDAALAGAGSGNGNGTGGGGKSKHALLKDRAASLESGQIYTVALMGRLVDSSATIVVLRQKPQKMVSPRDGG